jgi:LmbE family N-acetylglucosaminyl deacetylase
VTTLALPTTTHAHADQPTSRGRTRARAGLGTVVFLHAHPDDEAIFTGGTLALLARQGGRGVVVTATSGELGDDHAASSPTIDATGTALATRREVETATACAHLGVARLELLRYHDSGLGAAAAPLPRRDGGGSFAGCDVDTAARRVAHVLREERAAALVVYDAAGIYGHPDHVQVHRVGHRAARLAGVPTVYEATVDREHLHFVATHVVRRAHAATSARSTLGTPTVLVDTVVDVRPVLAAKRAAVAAHRSQIPASSDLRTMPDATFAAVYGYEWYVRAGPRGPLDRLAGG